MTAVPTAPIDAEPTGQLTPTDTREQLLATLADAGIELGEHDRLIVDWLTVSPGWEWSTVATIASWVKRAGTPNADTDHAGGSIHDDH